MFGVLDIGVLFNETIMRKDETIIIQSNRCTPENISSLQANEVFVFGSKPNGHHKAGAAKMAKAKFGAIEGVGEGHRGQSYAIPVHKHHTELLESAILRFIDYAISHRDLIFYVLPIGCISAGLDYKLVANMFRSARDLPNVFLPLKFYSFLFSFDKQILLTYKNVDNGIELVGDISQFFECDGVSLCQYDGTVLILPSTIAGQPIKTIGVMAFEQECGMPSLPIYWKTLIVPEGVEVIGHRAFSYNPDIETLILPDSLKEIQSWAFGHCENLKNVLFGDGDVYMHDLAFDACPNINFYSTCKENLSIPVFSAEADFYNCQSKKERIAYSISKEEFFRIICKPVNIHEEIERHEKYQTRLRWQLNHIYKPQFKFSQNNNKDASNAMFYIEFCSRQILNDEASLLRLQQLLNKEVKYEYKL